MACEIEIDWVHVAYQETSPMREVYGFVGMQGSVQLEGVRFRPKGSPNHILMMYMHPASTLELLPLPRAMAAAGVHVLCAGSRYARNDTPLVMEKVLADYGAYVRHAKEVWGYDKVVLAGWSGGGSLTICYQAQAEIPTITKTAAGEAIDLSDLIPGDAVIFHAAHLSRAEVLRDFIDPSVLDESNPDVRDSELDLYDPRNPNKPPYSADYISLFRQAQIARVKRRTNYARELLDQLRQRGGKEAERGLLTHRTLADPRFLDILIEPNDRQAGQCFMGDPETANFSPAGVARYSTASAWLSQWSLEDTCARADLNIANVSVPLLAIENSADDAVPQQHTFRLYEASPSALKEYHTVHGANHYYAGQPDQLAEAVKITVDWLKRRGLYA